MDWLLSNSGVIMIILTGLGGITALMSKNVASAVWFGCMYIGNIIMYFGFRLLEQKMEDK